MKSKLKLGTRKSLLAWAQSSWVAREVSRLNPGIEVELVGIETKGDQIQDVSLRNVEGKEFFVAEIDDALASGKVDFTVHSLKDLSLDRPKSFTCGAIPPRENPRDVILFGPRAYQRIQAGEELKIGTSSPRRIENIPAFLKKALPRLESGNRAEFEFHEIRGNVNTRLGRTHLPIDSEKYLDAVVLAMAGIIRLSRDSAGKAELVKLLEGVRWMVLPLRECPTAPGQGALSVECRTKDTAIIEILNRLHDPKTAAQVGSERQVLSDWGGGCHQRFGATSLCSEEMGELLFIKGVKPDGSEIDEFNWKSPELKVSGRIEPWDGSQWHSEKSVFHDLPEIRAKSAFIAHSSAVEKVDPLVFRSLRVWTSGVSSWFKLAEKGIWVEGCAEGFGFDSLIPTLGEKVLGLPHFQDWVVLTHQDASEGWEEVGIKVIPTYKINFNYLEEVKSLLAKATHVFWSSGSQYNELKGLLSKGVLHACGPGKTAVQLRKSGLLPVVFPNPREWRNEINKGNEKRAGEKV